MRREKYIAIRASEKEKKDVRLLADKKGFKTLTSFIMSLVEQAKKSANLILVFFVFGLLGLFGCATIDNLDNTRIKAPQRMESEIINNSYDDVFEVAKISCAESKLRIIKFNKAQGKIYAERPAEWFEDGSGETIGIYLTKLNENQTKIELAIQKNDIMNFGYTDSRSTVLNLIRAKLSHHSPQEG